MGFQDEAKNVLLLEAHNGKVIDVVRFSLFVVERNENTRKLNDD